MRSLFTLLFFLFFLFDLISQPTFQKRIGNASDNRLGKVIFHANNYYVLGKNDTKATVSKLDINGNLVWTNQTNTEAFWNDIIVNKDGNLMVVGSLGSNQNNTTNNASLCGVINTGSGAFTLLKSFQIGFRELLNRIYINPVPNNNSFPYYVVGTKTSSSGSNDDDLAILTFDADFNFGSGKTYTNGSDDDQLHYDVFFGGTNGAMMTIGNNYNGNFFEGRTATIGKDLVPLSGRDFGQSVVFFSGLSLPNSTGGFQQILAGTTTSGPSDAVIIKANGLTTVYSYKIPALDVINYMSTGASGNIFAIGRGEFGGITKTVILNLQDNNTSLTLNWAKVLDQGETVYSNGYLNFILPDKLMITDSRLGGNAVIGDFDGLFCVEQNNLENCMDVTVNVVLVANPMNITEWSISSANIGNITFTNETGTLLSYQATNPCAPPCNITSQIQNQNTGCGLYQFQIQSAGGTGPYSYQWDFNCDGTNEHTGSLISHSFSNPGTQQYCITVTDAIGCTATDSKTIVVVGDFLPPVITCPPHITVECADDILADLAETGNATATDDVDPNPDLLYEDNIQGTTCSYISTRIWTATDNCQRTNSCTQLITVIDRLAPEIVCPPNLTLSCDADLFDNMITGNATASDRCGNSFIISSNVGNGQGGACNSMWPKTYTATDICGNSRSCTQTITLRDNVPPVILCPTDKTISCEQIPLPSLTGTAIAEDNCQTNTLTPTYSDMNTGAGCEVAIIRTWTINDGCGNISSCQQTIQFDDFLPPNMVCPPDITISCETPADQINTGSATASDNCQTNLVIGYSDIVAGNNCNKIITRFWNTNDGCGNPGFCYQVITQIDITAPTINCPPNTTISCNAITTPANTGMATASDNCTENINIRHTDAFTAQGCTQDLIRTWTAMDECENVNTCIQTITLIDDIKPNVVCPPDLTISCGTNNSPAFTGEPTVSDFCQSDLIVTYQDTSSGSPCDVTISRTWTVSDGCSNESFCIQVITQRDTTPPNITCPSNLTISCNANTTPSSTGTATATDNCTSNINIRHLDDFTAQGCVQNLIRTWSATDDCENVDTCVQTITLIDDIKPNVVCPPDLTLSCGADNSPAFTGEPTVSDFCQSDLIVTYQDTSSGPPCDVTIIRTWTINDGCGNVSTCDQIIKLEDKSPPTFICPPSNINPIECTANPSLGTPSNVMDNCGGKIDQTKVDVFSTDGCFTTVTRTWTVTDQCGNSATCDQVILMQDTKAPVITNCGRKFIVQGMRNPDGICYGNATISTPDVSDECSENVMITNSFNNTSNASSGYYPVGQTIVTWTAKDECGLMTMCMDTVVVLECDIFLNCKCPSNPTFTLKEGNKNPISVSCNQLPNTIPVLDCPADQISISGNFGCISSNPNVPCPTNIVNWTLDRPTLPDLTGSASGTTFGVTFNASEISTAGNYILNLTSICGSDTCRCEIKWIQRECPPECKCPSNPTFTLKEGNKNPISVSCNQLPNTIPVLDCPADQISISGNFGCISSNPNVPCPSNIVNWTLDRPTLPDLTGNASGTTFGVTFNASDISTAGNYILNLTSICGSDTCRCEIKWIQRECPPECKCPSNPTFTLKEGNKNPISVSCNQLPNTIPVLDCPADQISISGNFGCISSNPNVPCPTNIVNWTLDRPTLPDLTGSVSGATFGVTFNANDILIGGNYTINMITICGKDTCRCVIRWTQKECSEGNCCTSFANPTNNPFGLTGGKSILGMDFIDVNGDTYMDHIYANSTQLLYRLNPGNGSNFGSEQVLASNLRQPYNCDYDQDGKEDIFGISITPALPSLGYIKNLGGGSFSSINSILTLSNVRFAVGDISQDGVIDLITVNASSNSQIMYYEGIPGPNPSFKAGAAWFTTNITNTFNAEFPIPELYDIDCDGDLDLFLGLSGEIRRFINNGGVIAPNTLPNFNTTGFINQTYNQIGGSEFITPRYVNIDSDAPSEFFIDYNSTQNLLYFDCATSAVDETLLSVQQFKVFPNPTSNMVTLKYTGDRPVTGNLDILNLWGQNVMTLNDVILEQDYSIDMSHLSSGMYLLRIASKQNQHIFLKIIKTE